MSEAVLGEVRHRGQALLDTLGGDLRAIEDATAAYRIAVDTVRAQAAWHATPGLAVEARAVLEGVERLTANVKHLTQASAHRLAALQAAGATPLYGRTR